MAKQAKKYFDQNLPGTEGAGAAINQLIASFEAPLGPGHSNEQIAAFRAKNYAPINLGIEYILRHRFISI